ncbi:hypothetical protein GPL15_04450 [Clostridium sp. MCC353]|uniref:DUF5688 family protein n=1 Tax=Clostridium sp. MCC353 TaxID=2592646 RepID=UPI001C0346F6|nr:DUF5688 family protein [Clostridium sp. MCC353]MBT9775762.1 hypothetical protein [Clostridium sp. MCC353]
MVYTSFLNAVKQQVEDALGGSYSIQIRQVSKNNGLVLDGICISPPDGQVAPTIYLNPYFPLYEKGMSLQEIAQDILSIYKDNSNLPVIDTQAMTDFSKLSTKVIYKLVQTASNQELLKDIPHIPYLDLSIVFYLFLEETASGQMTAMIHNDHQTLWNVTTTQLYELAKANTPILLPPTIKSMPDVMKEIAADWLGDDYQEEYMEQLEEEDRLSPLYVLSNRSNINGSAAILYHGVLKNFADRLGQDLIILPSSVHEVLLLPYDKTTDITSLNEMVISINQSEVPAEDQLSNQIYLYTRSDNQISLITNSSVPIGTRNP